MIDGIEITITCDRMPVCEPIRITQDGPEVDYDLLKQNLELFDWKEHDGEHICPACVPVWESERRAERRAEKYEHAADERLRARDTRAEMRRFGSY